MRYLILLIVLCSSSFVQADINNVPQKDLTNIKNLFKNLIEDHDYSYTVFGSKPMSLADFVLEVSKDRPFYKRIKSHIFVQKRKASLNSWYKYKHEFDLKDFIFLDDENDLFDCLVLVLINKKNMLNILREHERIFKEELGEDFTPESFLKKLAKREISLAKATRDSDRLLGIMLGYGDRNAVLFQERLNFMRAISKQKKEGLQLDEKLSLKLNEIEAQVGDFNDLEEDAIIHPLYFLADTSHPETIALKKRYAQDREAIEKLMKNPRFMDLVLQRLFTHESDLL